MTQTAHAVIGRWDAGIADIHRRFDGILHEATQVSAPIVAGVELDLAPLTQAWGAVEHRMHAHTEEVSDLWDEISDELGDLDDVPEHVMTHEGNKRDFATCEIELRYLRAYRSVMAHAAQNMLHRALATDAIDAACTQCGAQLDRIHPVSQALNVECAYCRAVNTVQPKHALRMFAASGAMYLGEAAAMQSFEAMKRAEAQIDCYRERKDVPYDLLEHYRACAHHYFSTRFGVEAQYVPEEQQYVPRRMERYMHDVTKKLRGFWQWRQRAG